MAWRGPTAKPSVNKAPNPINHGPEMSSGKRVEPENGSLRVQNRAYAVRRDKDKDKNFSVNLIDIDGTILTYLDTVISPTIIDSGRQVKVPVNYASPERWKAIRKDGVLRDKNGKMQCPAIAFRRTTFQRNDSMITLNRYLQYPVVRKFSEKNKYDKFSMMTGFSKVKEIHSVVMPDHIIINYDFIIWTELVEQGNSVVEAINFATEDYWGDKKRYKFRTSISDFNFETEVTADSDRVVKSTFSLMVYAYLLPDKFENYKSTTQKAFTPRKVVFDTEVSVGIGSMNIDQLNKVAQEISLKSYSNVGGRGSTQYADRAGYADRSGHASYADMAGTASYMVGSIENAISASYAATASYLSVQGNYPTTLASLNLVGGGTTGSFGTNIINGVTPDSGSAPVDIVNMSAGNAAEWLVSINDGGLNFKTSKVVSTWNNSFVNFYNTEVSQIGSVPVHLSVNNVGGTINLIATPLSGTWTIKMIRMMV